MKHVSFLTLFLLLSGLPVAVAQTDGEAPPEAPVAGDPGAPPVVDPDEPLPNDVEERPLGEEDVQDPEPEVSEPEPEVSEPVEEAGTGLGEADPEPAIEEDIEAAETEAVAPASRPETAEGTEGGAAGAEPVSTADRLGSVAGGVGLPWTAPITWTHNLTTRTLQPNGQLTYDPTYSWSFNVRPRWIFDHGTSLGIRQDLDVELTQSNFTARDRQLWWGDTQLDATFTLPWKPLGLILSPSLTLRLPTSLISRSQSRVLGPGVRMLALRPFAVGHGLIVGLQGAYTGWLRHGGRRIIQDSNPPTCNGSLPQGGAVGLDTPNTDCGAGGPGPNDHSSSVAVFGTYLPIDRLAINVSVAYIFNRNADLGTDCTGPQVTTADGTPYCLGDNSEHKTLIIGSFAMSVGYDITPYFTASIGYSTLAFYPDSDGTPEHLFYNENSQFSLSFQFRPAALIAQRRAAQAEEDADAEQVANAVSNFDAARL